MPKTLVVIGAGYSGTATAVQLLRQAPSPDLRIVLVGQDERAGPGLAYRARDDRLLLNVPAGNMSALAQDAGHFARYCAQRSPAWHEGSFVPRHVYGDYLAQTLEDAEAAGTARFEFVHDAALRLHQGVGAWRVELAGGRSLDADAVVLATGHQKPRPLAPPGLPGLIEDPWDFDSIDRADPSAPVLLVGSGHTAVDVALRLAARPRRAPTLLLSRHGLLPHAHRPRAALPHPGPLAPEVQQAVLAGRVRALVRAVRRWTALRAARGADWRDVINDLRPRLPSIWAGLDEDQRRQFLRHVLAYWDIHRHRLAPEAATALQASIEAGQVQRLAGRLQALAARGGAIACVVHARGAQRGIELQVGTVVNCTGPDYDLERAAPPLLSGLRAQGLMVADPLGLGPRVGPAYELIGADGRAAPGLFYIGPGLKARDWEAIAVPELRGHALRLAAHLLVRR